MSAPNQPHPCYAIALVGCLTLALLAGCGGLAVGLFFLPLFAPTHTSPVPDPPTFRP